MPLLQINRSVCPEVDISSLAVGEPTIRFVVDIVNSEYAPLVLRYAQRFHIYRVLTHERRPSIEL